jgi:uncharacterized protein
VNNSLLASILIPIGFLAAIALVFSEESAYAQNIIQNTSKTGNNTLHVMGNAQMMVKPDKVTLSLSVETTNKTANEALVANSQAMNNTLEALKAAGVMENETSTSFFNIVPNYNITQEEEGLPPIESRDIISYTVTNSITVDSYNLLNVSQWIDTAVQAGVNDIRSISFGLSNEKSEAVKNGLLKQAVANAKNKAVIAASALGLNVIGVKSVIVEGLDGFPPIPQPFFAKEAVAAAAPEAGPPIIAGEQEVTSRVNIVFLIG